MEANLRSFNFSPKVESGTGTANDVSATAMQNFWDSALNLDPPDDYDNHRYSFGLSSELS